MDARDVVTTFATMRAVTSARILHKARKTNEKTLEQTPRSLKARVMNISKKAAEAIARGEEKPMYLECNTMYLFK